MSKQEIEITLKVPVKSFRKAYVLLDEDVPSDEDIVSKFDCKTLNTDKLGPAGEEFRFALACLMIGEVEE